MNDYAEGMCWHLQHFDPNDYILGTGETRVPSIAQIGLQIVLRGRGRIEIDAGSGRVLVKVAPVNSVARRSLLIGDLSGLGQSLAGSKN